MAAAATCGCSTVHLQRVRLTAPRTCGTACIRVASRTSGRSGSSGSAGPAVWCTSSSRGSSGGGRNSGAPAPAAASTSLSSTDASLAAEEALQLGGLQRSAAAVAASNGLGQMDTAQLDAAIAAALRRVATSMADSAPSQGGSTSNGSSPPPMSQGDMHRVIEDEVHAAFESEMEGFNQAVHVAFEAEMETARQTVKDAVDDALTENMGNMGVTANVNTLMAVTGVIAYWRGVGGLLDILLEDSLEGYVACVVFGFSIIGVIRKLKLPVVEGGSVGF